MSDESGQAMRDGDMVNYRASKCSFDVNRGTIPVRVPSGRAVAKITVHITGVEAQKRKASPGR